MIKAIPGISTTESCQRVTTISIKKKAPKKIDPPKLIHNSLSLTQDVQQIREAIRYHFIKSQQIPLPTRLDYYRIGRTLGRGAFGKVSMCLHKLSHSLVAIKSIKKDASKGVKQRTLIEMTLQQSCRDRNVI